MDIQETKAQRHIAGNPDELLQSILNASEDDVFIVDQQLRVIFANSAMMEKYHTPESPLIGNYCYAAIYQLERPCHSPAWKCPLTGVMESHSAVKANFQACPAAPDMYLRIIGYPLLDSSGQVMSMMEIRRDITSERQRDLRVQAHHNQVTALQRLSRAVTDLKDLETVLKIGLDVVMDLVGSEMGGILLLDEKTNSLQYGVQRGLSP